MSRATRPIVLLLVIAGVAVVIAWTRDRDEAAVPTSDVITSRPIEEHSGGYVGSDACRTCHTEEHAAWHASYHRTMTQIATPESVVGDFNARLQLGDQIYTLSRKEDEFWVDMPVPEGVRTDGETDRLQRRIVLTTGSHHMQACWFPVSGDSRLLGMLPFVYLLEEGRWIPQSASFLSPPHTEADEPGRWNVGCIRCHATQGRPGLDVEPGVVDYNFRDFDTRVAEFGIACEACHGPGEQHVRANQPDFGADERPAGDETADTIVHPGRLSHDLSAQVCGQCHGVFRYKDDEAHAQFLKTGWTYRPGDDLADSTLRNLRRCSGDWEPEDVEPLRKQFWTDGMVRVSGREYNGLVESPCYQRGQLSCLDCHQMHRAEDDPRPLKQWANDQLGPERGSNQACIQCHDTFDTVAALVEHTHHPAASAGSQCYNCHMPFTTYGLLKAIRSHQISSPSVSESLETGRPNACNQCHLDKTLRWSADHLTQWYGRRPLELTDDQESVAASLLWLLSGDAGQRALMAWSFGWTDAQQASGTDWMPPYLAILMQDPYDAVRYIAFRSLRGLAQYQYVSFDFVGGPEHCSAVSAEVLRFWQNQPRLDAPNRALLQNDTGGLMKGELTRLIEQRNRRPVDLQE